MNMRAPNYISDAMNSEHRLSESGCYEIQIASRTNKYHKYKTAMHKTVAMQIYNNITVPHAKKRLLENGKVIAREKYE